MHRAATPDDARRIILDIARDEGVDARGEVQVDGHRGDRSRRRARSRGIETVETDLGEYIVQVAGERPSHMIVPAIHKTLAQVASVLQTRADEELPVEHEAITAWARDHLRQRFLAADLGITGANFVAADTGTIVLVTNEGNGDLCTIVPRVQIAVVPVEKVIARFSDLATLLPLLTMSATGQRISNYVTMINGPRRVEEIDGPESLHVVFLDHGRLRLAGTAYEDMLACIRCGACLNVCPVFRRISGHAYDAVYSGPMGKVLTPCSRSTAPTVASCPRRRRCVARAPRRARSQIPLADLLVRLRADLRRRGPGRSAARRPEAASGARWRHGDPARASRPGCWAQPLASRPPPRSAARRRVRRLGPACGRARPATRRSDRSRSRWARVWSVAGRDARWTRGRSRASARGPRPATRPVRRRGRSATTGPHGRKVRSDGEVAALTEQFLTAAAENGMVVHGPFAAGSRRRGSRWSERRRVAGDRCVAVPVADPLDRGAGAARRARVGGLRAAGRERRPRGGPRSATRARASPVRAPGIAATGTLLLPCGPGPARGTHIIPPAHVCVVRAEDLVATIEDAIALQALRAASEQP